MIGGVRNPPFSRVGDYKEEKINSLNNELRQELKLVAVLFYIKAACNCLCLRLSLSFPQITYQRFLLAFLGMMMLMSLTP